MTIADTSQETAAAVKKFAGRLLRLASSRVHYAECLDPDCPYAWEGNAAVISSSWHCIQTGHIVRQDYTASYTITVNPNTADYGPLGNSKARRQLSQADRIAKHNLDE